MRRRQVGRSRGGRRWAGPATAGEGRRRTYGRCNKDGGAPVRSQRRKEAVAGRGGGSRPTQGGGARPTAAAHGVKEVG
jgi:hypothetical protein